ncbi:PQQ-binding-like beta-propeller repeat protein [Microlunatus sp. GCM10028923]|uniref:outer membrane protein assembly factor BamB family protein n=1 Tax=Microlunatus sp. GCM10028923 TaxID=3273400 RepID=UPI00361F7A41
MARPLPPAEPWSWQRPGEPAGPGRGVAGPSFRPRRPGVSGAVVRVVVPLLLLGIVWALAYPSTRLPAPDPGIGRYLPVGDPVAVLIDGTDGRPWQANQGLREPGAGPAELTAPVRRLLGAPGDGAWLMVDAIRPDQQGRLLRLAYQVGDGITLRAYQDSAGWAVFSPGLPMLAADPAAGGSTRWTGTAAVKNVADAGSGDDPAAAPAEAVITTRPHPSRPFCLATNAELAVGGMTVQLGATWCSGEQAGWAGAEAPTYVLEPAAGSVPAPEAPADPSPALPRLDGDEVRQLRFLTRLAGRWQEHPAIRPSRLAAAGPTLVIADVDGVITGWQRLPDEQPAEAYYGQLWRVRPGGSVRGLATIGGTTVVGTTARMIIGYGSDGWQRWRHEIDDAVVDVARLGSDALVTDASGRLRLLDGRTGAVRWETDGGDLPWPPVLDDRTIVFLDGDTVRVVDAATGRDRWSAAADQRSTEVALAGDLVLIKVGNWLVARGAADGRHRWTRAVPAGALLTGGADQVVIFGDESTSALDLAGNQRWAAPAAAGARGVGDGIALIMKDRIEVRRADGSAATLPFPAGFGQPDPAPVVTPTGLLALQRDPETAAWWEYR